MVSPAPSSGVQIEWKDSTNGTVQSFVYGFNNAGMITSAVYRTGERMYYYYDGIDRLTNVTTIAAGATNRMRYYYDLAGNRTNVTGTGVTNRYTYGQGNRLASFGTGTTNEFDLAGNVTNIMYSAANQLLLNWDGQYRMTQVKTNGVVAESYQYDPLGRRSVIDSGTETNYLAYDGVNGIADLNATGGLVRSYVWGGIDNMLAMTVYTGATATTYYPLKDHLGTIHAMADTNGVVVEQYKYTAWGQTTVYDANTNLLSQSAIGNRYLWQGREYSWKSGLYYFRARWYDPITGRWLSNDPIGVSGGWNQYVFCGNNTLNVVDPFGLEGQDFYDQLLDSQANSPSTATLGNQMRGDSKQEVDKMLKGARDSVVMAVTLVSFGEGKAGVGALSRLCSWIKRKLWKCPGGRAAAKGITGAAQVKGDKFFTGFAKRNPINQTTRQIGDYTEFAIDVPGDNGQSFTRWVKVVDSDGRTIRLYHDTFDNTGKFLNRGIKIPGPERHVQ